VSFEHELSNGFSMEGCRGSKPVNLKELSGMLMAFSDLVIDIQDTIESMDLNPVLCTAETCVVVHARILLKTGN